MNQQNVNFFPWDEISEDNVFPTGVYHFRVDELEDGMSGTGKRMFRARFTCKAPQEQTGMSHFENYVTGTDENPTGIVPGTMGARGLKKLLAKAQVPSSNDIGALCASARGAEVLMTLNFFVEKDGQYAGTPRNRIADYHRLGERQVGVTQPLPGQGVSAGRQTGPPAQPPGPGVPPVQPGVPVSPPPPTASAGPPPPAQPAQPPAQPAQPAGPPAPPPAGPPAQPTGVPPAVPPALPTQPTAEPVMRCTICQQDVGVSQFGAHIQAHAAQMPA